MSVVGDLRGRNRSRGASTAGRFASLPRCAAQAGSTAGPSITQNRSASTTSVCPPTRSCCMVPVVPRRTRPSTSTRGTRLWGTTCPCSSSVCLQQSRPITPNLSGEERCGQGDIVRTDDGLLAVTRKPTEAVISLHTFLKCT